MQAWHPACRRQTCLVPALAAPAFAFGLTGCATRSCTGRSCVLVTGCCLTALALGNLGVGRLLCLGDRVNQLLGRFQVLFFHDIYFCESETCFIICGILLKLDLALSFVHVAPFVDSVAALPAAVLGSVLISN